MTKNVFVRLKVVTFCVAIFCFVSSVESHLMREKRAEEQKGTEEHVTDKSRIPSKEDVKPPVIPPSTKTDANESNPAPVGFPASVSNNSPSPPAKPNPNPNESSLKQANKTVLPDTKVHSPKGDSEQNSESIAPVPSLEDSKLYPPGAALRGLYVFVGLSSVVMVYIAIKLVRLRRKRTRIRKYGLLANIDDVEMKPLGAEEEDEESTLFDVNQLSGQRSNQQGGR